MKKFIFCVFALALLASCSSNVDLAIDNPTNSDITVAVDSLQVNIPANEVVWVEMGKGPRNITLPNDSIVEFDFQKSVYMLNPTFAKYLKSGEVYGNNPLASSGVNRTVEFLGMELEGDFALVDQLVNEVTWEYGPRETLPEMIEMDASESYAIIYKLYSERELLQELESAADYDMQSEP